MKPYPTNQSLIYTLLLDVESTANSGSVVYKFGYATVSVNESQHEKN